MAFAIPYPPLLAKGGQQQPPRPLLHRLLLACLLFFLSASSARASDSEWVLTQTQVELGKYTVYVSKDALKIVNDSLGYEVVARGPAWNVVVYRPDEKRGCELPLNVFLTKEAFSILKIGKMREKKRALIKLATEESNGLKICEYKTPDGLEQNWTTESFGAPEQAIEVLETSYRLRMTNGFPLRVIVYHKPERIETSSWMNGGINMGLHSRVEHLKTSGWKKLPYRASDFTYPNGYTQVKDIDSLQLSSVKKHSMDDMLQDMGLGEQLGSHNK
jgi:hypothetical protein